MKDSKLIEKSKDFAKEIIKLCKDTNLSKAENVIIGQLLRSGTSIGANIHEAQYAQSKMDFISKFEIALKECYESMYWLELLYETGYILENDFKILNHKCGEIRRMLIATCKTLKEN